MISRARLISTTYLDIRQQYRNGFYFVMLIALISSVIVMSQLPKGLVALIFPIFIMSNIITGTFLFMGALVLYERNQSIPEALNVTPISPHEYLLSKIFTLTLLGLIEGGLMVGFASIIFDVALNEMTLIFGLIILGLIYSLSGFITVAKYQNFNEFMSKGIGIVFILSLPFSNFFTTNMGVRIILYLIPTNPALLLMSNSSMSIFFVINFILCLLWIVILYKFGIRAYESDYENRRR